MVQGSHNIFAVDKIASLRTPLGNREANTISFDSLFMIMHEGRKTKRELSDRIIKLVNKKT